MEQKYNTIGKCLYFPESKMVVIGDLHLGFEQMLHEQGLLFPIKQIEQVKIELEEIFNEIINNRNNEIKKVILLGDIKHYFRYDKGEKHDVFELFEFLRKYVDDENIIVIKGNHDKFDLGKEFIDYYIEEGVAFVHGHKDFLELYDKNIKLIVMGHLHSSVLLEDDEGIKKEEYKCFLGGKWKGKEVITVPSFLPFIEGGKVENYEEQKAIISKKDLENFKIYIVGENLKEQALGFGRLGDL